MPASTSAIMRYIPAYTANTLYFIQTTSPIYCQYVLKTLKMQMSPSSGGFSIRAGSYLYCGFIGFISRWYTEPWIYSQIRYHRFNQLETTATPRSINFSNYAVDTRKIVISLALKNNFSA